MTNITDNGSYIKIDTNGNYFFIAKNAVSIQRNESQVLLFTADTRTLIRAFDYATIQTPVSTDIDDLVEQLTFSFGTSAGADDITASTPLSYTGSNISIDTNYFIKNQYTAAQLADIWTKGNSRFQIEGSNLFVVSSDDTRLYIDTANVYLNSSDNYLKIESANTYFDTSGTVNIGKYSSDPYIYLKVEQNDQYVFTEVRNESTITGSLTGSGVANTNTGYYSYLAYVFKNGTRTAIYDNRSALCANTDLLVYANFDDNNPGEQKIYFAGGHFTYGYFSNAGNLILSQNGTALASITADNGIDKLQVNGTVKLNLGTVSANDTIVARNSAGQLTDSLITYTQLNSIIAGGSGIQNQIAAPQSGANWWISGRSINGTGTDDTKSINQIFGTLTDQGNAQRIAVTMPSTITAAQSGILYNITGAGSSTLASHALRVNHLAGATGVRQTASGYFVNNSLATGTTGNLTDWNNFLGNYALIGQNRNTSTGLNVGVAGTASLGNINIGIAGTVDSNKSGSKNIGVLGYAPNTGGSYRAAGYFYNGDDSPTNFNFFNACLISHSRGTDPIFRGVLNNTHIFLIDENGRTGIGPGPTFTSTTEWLVVSASGGGGKAEAVVRAPNGGSSFVIDRNATNQRGLLEYRTANAADWAIGTGYTSGATASDLCIATFGGNVTAFFTRAAQPRFIFGLAVADDTIHSYQINGNTKIAAGTVASSRNALLVSGTLPTNFTTGQYGADYTITSAGTSANTGGAMIVRYAAGYTGAGATYALNTSNVVAGTGTNWYTASGNMAVAGSTTATTTGTNVGVFGTSGNGNINIAGVFVSNTTKNSATNGGVVGIGANAGTSPTAFGGYFGLDTAIPTLTSGALIANNGATTFNILQLQDNGTPVVTVADGGAVLINTITNNGTDKLQVNGTISANLGTATPGDTVIAWNATTKQFVNTGLNYSALGGGGGSYTAGSGIDITSNVISNIDKGSDQYIFKQVRSSGQPTITADSNTDSIYINGTNGITVSTDAFEKTVTLSVGNPQALNANGSSHFQGQNAQVNNITYPLQTTISGGFYVNNIIVSNPAYTSVKALMTGWVEIENDGTGTTLVTVNYIHSPTFPSPSVTARFEVKGKVLIPVHFYKVCTNGQNIAIDITVDATTYAPKLRNYSISTQDLN